MIERTRERFTIAATIGDGWYETGSSLHLVLAVARAKKRGSRTPRRVGRGLAWRRPVQNLWLQVVTRSSSRDPGVLSEQFARAVASRLSRRTYVAKEHPIP